MSQSADIAHILLDIEAVTLSPEEPYQFASGLKSPIYCDNRLIISYPEQREKVLQAFLATIKEENYDYDIVAGTATAGIPWASLIAHELKKPMIYVRGSSKTHGKGNQIEGRLEPGQKVLLIEDLISTGGSSDDAVTAIKELKSEVVACIAIFTYQMAEASKTFEQNQVPLKTLSCFDDLLKIAVNGNMINDIQKQSLLKWKKDPLVWGFS